MNQAVQHSPAVEWSVPADKSVRDAMRRAVDEYGNGLAWVPPLSLEEIVAHAEEVVRAGHFDPSWRGFAAVLVGNAVWRDTVAAIPFERRILLLPQCLRSSSSCTAESDALGLLCEECGTCRIGDIQKAAEALGYVVLVAEGTTAVSELLNRGEADAVIGVSCLDALEKSFRPLLAHAIPGLAVPLLRNGCVDTEVDLDWILEVIRLHGPPRPYSPRLDIQACRREVSAWFTPASLDTLLNLSHSRTEALALEWVAQGGKRWRPTLAVAVYRALTHSPGDIPATLKKVAVAVECFHKASLAHDDIEDDDDSRYGTPTLHRRTGMAVALNVGDLLIGEGYRLLAESGAPADQVSRMVAVAAGAHRTLCIGQGAELLLRNTPERITVDGVLEMLRCKTAPAYEVALQLGAICANADAETTAVLTAFSAALGVAYQVRDDLEDLAGDHAPRPGAFGAPSLLAALAREEGANEGPAAPCLEQIRNTGAERRARELIGQYESAARQALRPLRHAALKSLLHRLAARILAPAP